MGIEETRASNFLSSTQLDITTGSYWEGHFEQVERRARRSGRGFILPTLGQAKQGGPWSWRSVGRQSSASSAGLQEWGVEFSSPSGLPGKFAKDRGSKPSFVRTTSLVASVARKRKFALGCQDQAHRCARTKIGPKQKAQGPAEPQVGRFARIQVTKDRVAPRRGTVLNPRELRRPCSVKRSQDRSVTATHAA